MPVWNIYSVCYSIQIGIILARFFTKIILHRYRKNSSKIHMELQNTLIKKSWHLHSMDEDNLMQNNKNDVFILSDFKRYYSLSNKNGMILAKRQTHQSMKWSRKPKNPPMYICGELSFYRNVQNTMEKHSLFYKDGWEKQLRMDWVKYKTWNYNTTRRKQIGPVLSH